MKSTLAATDRRALLRHEAIVGIALNAVLSIVSFLLVFGWRTVPNAPLAVDFFPQTLGIAVFGTIVPTVMTARKIAKGKVVAAELVPSWPIHGLRVIAIALTMTALAGGGAAAALTLFGPEVVPPAAAIAMKAAYGAAAGIPLTLGVLRSVLGLPVLPKRRARLADV